MTRLRKVGAAAEVEAGTLEACQSSEDGARNSPEKSSRSQHLEK
jgi:hypothetical protein